MPKIDLEDFSNWLQQENKSKATACGYVARIRTTIGAVSPLTEERLESYLAGMKNGYQGVLKAAWRALVRYTKARGLDGIPELPDGRSVGNKHRPASQRLLAAVEELEEPVVHPISMDLIRFYNEVGLQVTLHQVAEMITMQAEFGDYAHALTLKVKKPIGMGFFYLRFGQISGIALQNMIDWGYPTKPDRFAKVPLIVDEPGSLKPMSPKKMYALMLASGMLHEPAIRYAKEQFNAMLQAKALLKEDQGS